MWITEKKFSFIASFIQFYAEQVCVMRLQQNDPVFPAFHSHWLTFVNDKAALVNPPTHSGNTEMDTPRSSGIWCSVPVHDRVAVPPACGGNYAGTGM